MYTFRLMVIAPSGACIIPAGGGGIGTRCVNLWSPEERDAIGGGGGGQGGGGGGGGAGAGGGARSGIDDNVESNAEDAILSGLSWGLIAVPLRRVTARKLRNVCEILLHIRKKCKCLSLKVYPMSLSWEFLWESPIRWFYSPKRFVFGQNPASAFSKL